MSGDPLAECTRIDWDNTWDTTTSYTSDPNSTCTYTVRYYPQPEDNSEKIKELIRKAIIREMKDQWNQLKKEFKPVPKLRPAVQLRGVCFSGRGWA